MRRSVVIIFWFIVISCGTVVEISKSAEVIRGIYDTGTASCYMSFKRDSTFEWFSGSALGATESHQCKYMLLDSVIYLDKIGFDNMVKSNKLIITTKNRLLRGFDGNYIIQVDSLNKLVDSIFIFTIINDKRDSLKEDLHNTISIAHFTHKKIPKTLCRTLK